MSQSSDSERVNARFDNSQPIATGRIVFVTFPKVNAYSGEPESRPAIVVNAWNSNCLNVVVFCDGSNDDRYRDGNHYDGTLTEWRTSVTYDAGEAREIDDPAKPGEKKMITMFNPQTWHWPARS